MVALAVGVKAVHQLLPAGPHQVLGQGQVPDGGVGRLIKVQAALVAQLPGDLGASVLQAAHGIYQAEGEVLLQAQDGGVVCLHNRRCHNGGACAPTRDWLRRWLSAALLCNSIISRVYAVISDEGYATSIHRTRQRQANLHEIHTAPQVSGVTQVD